MQWIKTKNGFFEHKHLDFSQQELYNCRGDTMETNLTIEKITNVFDGEFKPGTIQKKPIGRHCDCFAFYLYGKTEYKFDGYSFTAYPQKFIYLAKDSRYEMHILEKSKFICVDFDFCKLSSPQKSAAFKCNASDMKNQFQKTLHLWNNKGLCYLPQIFSYAYNIYTEAVKSENKFYSQSSLLVSDITAYILSNYTSPDFTVEDISKQFKISSVHLRRLFNQTLCTSPIKYINNLKLDKAKNMLKISNYSIAETAQSSGFADPYYFSRFFKKETGMTPLEYKKHSSEI